MKTSQCLKLDHPGVLQVQTVQTVQAFPLHIVVLQDLGGETSAVEALFSIQQSQQKAPNTGEIWVEIKLREEDISIAATKCNCTAIDPSASISKSSPS